MDFRLRDIEESIWDDFKEAARNSPQKSANGHLLELVKKEALRWRKTENERILRRADDIRQKKLI